MAKPPRCGWGSASSKATASCPSWRREAARRCTARRRAPSSIAASPRAARWVRACANAALSRWAEGDARRRQSQQRLRRGAAGADRLALCLLPHRADQLFPGGELLALLAEGPLQLDADLRELWASASRSL